VKELLEKHECAFLDRNVDRYRETTQYVLSKQGVPGFSLVAKFEIVPITSVTEQTQFRIESAEAVLQLQESATFKSLAASPSPTIRLALTHEAFRGEPDVGWWVTECEIENDPSSDWHFWIELDVKSPDGRLTMSRRFKSRVPAGPRPEVAEVTCEQSNDFQTTEHRKASLVRIKPPSEKWTREEERLKPASCATIHGPGDWDALPATTEGLILQGEGTLQRDFDRVGKFKKLKYLALEKWRTGRQLKLDALAPLEALETLYVHRLTTAGVDTLLHLKSLKIVFVEDATPLSDQDLVKLASLPALTSLLLRECPSMTDDVLKAISTSRTIEALKWTRSPAVTDEGLGHLAKLRRLRNLDISYGGKFTAKGYLALSGSKELTKLQIAHSGFDDGMLAAVSRIATLKRLWIYNAHGVTDAGLMCLENLTALERVYIDSDKTTKEGVLKLQASLKGEYAPD
jgi:hypothetical protein